MSQEIIHNIINQLQELEVEELHKLNQAIEQHITVKTQTESETAFEQAYCAVCVLTFGVSPHM